MSFVNAINLNEILATAVAQKRKRAEPVKVYAVLLHQEHGLNMDKTLKSGQSIKFKPSHTKAVDELKVRGADQLAGIVSLEGKEF